MVLQNFEQLARERNRSRLIVLCGSGFQNVGKVKTEASKKPIPIDPYVAEDLIAWYHTTKYVKPDDYIFVTDAACAGRKRGKQPLWLAKVMQYHIQPAAKRTRIDKNIGWHTFRHSYTTLLHANGEDREVVQELAARVG